MVVGCWLEKERRTNVARREGLEEELEAKGDIINFPRVPGVERQPWLHQHSHVHVCVCVFTFNFSIQ